MNEPTMETLARRLDRMERERSYSRGDITMTRRLWVALFVIAWPFMLFRTLPALAIDGSQWRQMPNDAKSVYIMGVVDTWGNVRKAVEHLKKQRGREETSALEQSYVDLVNCITRRGMRYVQVVAIVEKHMTDNPDQWNYGMSSNVWSAVQRVCKKATMG